MITKQKPWQQEGDILVRCYGNAMIMEDIVKDPFEEYIRQTEPSKKELAYAWHTAIGLQAVDGLETSSYLKRIARENIEGKITLQDANRLIENYYNESSEREAGRSRAADIVSARIVTVLSEKTFTFSVPQYVGIHKRLFEGIYFHAGKIRDYNLSKDEWVLDGASVHYGNALDLLAMLEYDFRMEKEYGYRFDSVSSIIPHLARFVSDLWQIHAFGEGNTRTTAVFFIKYLRTMGFNVTNDVFAENAWYFRNALVRANYTNILKGVRETTEYLELFLENLLLNESNELKNRYLHIRWDSRKQDIGKNKTGHSTEKQDIALSDSLNNRTKQNIRKLFNEFGDDRFFGRREVMGVLGITASPASTLIKKMLEMEIICPLKGQGKGKYLFKKK